MTVSDNLFQKQALPGNWLNGAVGFLRSRSFFMREYTQCSEKRLLAV